jgi:hypothetical protein
MASTLAATSAALNCVQQSQAELAAKRARIAEHNVVTEADWRPVLAHVVSQHQAINLLGERFVCRIQALPYSRSFRFRVYEQVTPC